LTGAEKMVRVGKEQGSREKKKEFGKKREKAIDSG